MNFDLSFARRTLLLLALMAWTMAPSSLVRAQLPSFNGAEGFGGTFTGTAPAGGWFANAEIYHVTTTQDILDAGKGAFGTLRGAFVDFSQANSHKQKASNRIVVFDVGGTFELTQGALDMKEINNIYIAGQTAPSPVTVYGNTSQITHSNNTLTSNVILRYMTFRKGTGEGADAISFAGGSSDGSGTISTNMIIDHVSASWSEDEVLSVANTNTNVTVQYSMLTDSLTNGHQYGSLIRARSDAQVTFHHNLYGNDKSRNPRPGTYNNKQLDLDFRNNVIYNWSDRAGYTGGASEAATEYVNVNYVGNYAVAGPATPAGQKSTTVFTMDVGSFYDLTTNTVISNPKDYIALQIHQSGNLVDWDHDAVRDGDLGPGGTGDTWAMFIASDGTTTRAYPDFNYGPNSGLAAKKATPFAYPTVTTQDATEAYNQVIDYAGNWWWNRDVIDQRIIGNVENNTQPAGGIPALAPIPSELAYVTGAAYPAAASTHPAGYDSDGDAMPDTWELAHGLNPNSNLDFKLDFDGDGYINLQEYLDEVGAFPAPAPIVFNGVTNARYAQITNWKTNDGDVTAGSNWQPTRFDEAQINSGTVVVDAVGQHAGLLKIAATANSTAQLQVNSGWLQVADAVVVGAHATGQGTLTLGGGQLVAPDVVVGYLGKLRGTGTLVGDVTNGGTVLPGNSPGTLSIDGDYTQTIDGILSIDLASPSSFDRLIVNGDVDFGGVLEVTLLDGYVPLAGATFNLLDWTGTSSGNFDILALDDLGSELVWDTSLLDSQGVLGVVAANAVVLAGDYNDDGTVDAADYTVWRDALSSGSPLLNETASPGTVDADDYDAWKTNFGATETEGSSSASTAVPEPATLCSACVVMLVIGAWYRKRSHRKQL